MLSNIIITILDSHHSGGMFATPISKPIPIQTIQQYRPSSSSHFLFFRHPARISPGRRRRGRVVVFQCARTQRRRSGGKSPAPNQKRDLLGRRRRCIGKVVKMEEIKKWTFPSVQIVFSCLSGSTRTAPPCRPDIVGQKRMRA